MKQSVSSVFELYLERSDLRPNSIIAKRRALRYFVEWFGDLPCSGVAVAMAEDYKVMLAKGRSKSAANTYLDNFRPFWAWLVGHGRISVNPFYHVKPYKLDEKPKVFFTPDDLAKMVRFFDLLWRVRLAFGLLGCRRGMMQNVLVREIHLDGETPHVELSYKTKSDRTWPWGQKDYGVRYIGLPERIQVGEESLNVHRDVVELMERLPRHQPYLCLTPKEYDRMLERQSQGVLTQDHINDPAGNFQRGFNLRQTRAGIKSPKRYHELRAAYITHLIDSVGIRRAQQAVGHKSLQTTARYDRTEIMKTVQMSNRATSVFGPKSEKIL